MTRSSLTDNGLRSFGLRFLVAVGAVLASWSLLVASASASYEQVQTFEGGKNALLGETKSMAVNLTGAGGVAPGTVYAATYFPQRNLLRYGPKGEFIGKTAVGDSDHSPLGVAIDQTTGYVYVLTEGSPSISVFNADGSQLITTFGSRVTSNETIANSPEKLHFGSGRGIAVDDSGTVYVSDLGLAEAGEEGGQQTRVMVFKPQSPGDYEHYVYSGRENDVAASHGSVGRIYGNSLALDDHNDIYLLGGEQIAEFALSEPDASPICNFELPAGGIEGTTINPETGEVFFLSYKNGNGHELRCNGQGEFLETGSFTVTPRPSAGYFVEALAFNPSLSYTSTRPSGVIYGASQTGLGYIFAPAEVLPPLVESESVSRVTTTAATLEAQINPKGSPARYVFQYISDASYQENDPGERFAGAAEAPLGGAPAGNGQKGINVAAGLLGLAPDTAYHYRAVASNCLVQGEERECEDIGPEQVFRTFPVEAPELPDGRHWELVSPAQKNGGEVWPVAPGVGSCNEECKPGGFRKQFPRQSSPDGEAVAYEGFPFSFTEGAVIENEYVSRRNAKTGWETTILAPELMANGSDQGYKAFNANLTRGLFYQVNPSLGPEAPNGYANLYSQPTGAPQTLSPLLTAEAPNRSAQGANKLVLTYEGASADFSRIFFEANDALTEETPFAPQAVDGGTEKFNLYEWHEGQLSLVNVLPGNTETIPGAALGSGTLLKSGNPNSPAAVVTNAISADGSHVFWSNSAGRVFVRIDGEYTEPIVDTGKYLAASADGSRVLLNDGCLYDIAEQECEALTEGHGGFQGVVGQSEDLSHVYFVDTAVLSETPNEQGAVAQAGKNNLYVWEDGVVSYVASDAVGGGAASPVVRTSEASPDGRWVTFLSEAPLTGYDNTGPCHLEPAATSPDGKEIPARYALSSCKEVFLYDSVTKRLTCASCNPTGERPLGPSNLSLIEGAEGSQQQPRYLSDSGRLFFDSQDSLSPYDTNGAGVQAGHAVEDVYEYEPEGVGDCGREKGCVRLISAGHEPVDSNFLAADEDGKNVFFTTRDQLVLKDHDELLDVYDAREGAPIPGETETGRGECQGEACQQAASPPNDPTPGSSTFEGAGNVNEPKAKKHAHKHKKKHAKKKHAHKRAAKHNRGGAK